MTAGQKRVLVVASHTHWDCEWSCVIPSDD